MTDVDLGERIFNLREEQLITQVELAEKARISPSTLSQIESGRATPHVSTVRKIARALGVSPQELRGKALAPPEKAHSGGAVERARGKLTRMGEEMNSPQTDAYLRTEGATITAMSVEEFLALEDLSLPEFRRHRRALEAERDRLSDRFNDSERSERRTSALAVMRAQLRLSMMMHPEERRRIEQAEEMANA